MWRHVNLMYITLNEEICGILPTCQFRLRPLNKLCGFPMNINFARTMVQTIFSPCFSSKAKSSPPTITMSGGISKCYIYIHLYGVYITVVCATFALRIVDPDQVIVAPCWHLSAPLDEDFLGGREFVQSLVYFFGVSPNSGFKSKSGKS